MTIYSHRDKGKIPLIILSVPTSITLVLFIRGFSTGKAPSSIWQIFLALILLILTMLFVSFMETRIDSGKLHIIFGPRMFSTSIPVDKIVNISQRFIPWYSTGVKKIHKGWLFSVCSGWGLLIELSDGKRYIIGSGDPEGLEQALKAAKETTRELGKDEEPGNDISHQEPSS